MLFNHLSINRTIYSVKIALNNLPMLALNLVVSNILGGIFYNFFALELIWRNEKLKLTKHACSTILINVLAPIQWIKDL